jgi:hypothetical protein
LPEDSYKKDIKNHLEAYLPALWLEGFGNLANLKLVKDKRLKGVTDVNFYKVKASTEFVIKFSLNDVPKEKEGHGILKKASPTLNSHLVPLLGEAKGVEDVGLNEAILLTPYINSLTLHEIVANYETLTTKSWILGLYHNFLNELRVLWKTTKKTKNYSLKDIYYKRLTSRLSEFKREEKLDTTSDLSLVINGKEKKSESEIKTYIQDRIEKLENKVKYSCTVHGDEHANNILIRKENIGLDERYWYLIDCGNALDRGDWIFSIAKILHWWKVYFIIESAKGKKDLNGYYRKISKNKIEVRYDAELFKRRLPMLCKKLYNKTLNFSKEVNEEIFKEKTSVWKERLNIALFTILFGAITRHLTREKRFAIPFLIGESFKFLESL